MGVGLKEPAVLQRPWRTGIEGKRGGYRSMVSPLPRAVTEPHRQVFPEPLAASLGKKGESTGVGTTSPQSIVGCFVEAPDLISLLGIVGQSAGLTTVIPL